MKYVFKDDFCIALYDHRFKFLFANYLMKVVHVIEGFASGSAYFVNLLTQYISDFEHVVIHGERAAETSAEAEKAKFPAGVSFVYWESAQREISPWKDLAALAELVKHLKTVKGDIIHLHSSKAGFLGRLACRLLGIKNVIYTPHGAAFSRQDVSKVKRHIFVKLEKIAASLGGKVVCCSQSEAQIFNYSGIYATYINNGTIIPKENSLSNGEVPADKLIIVVTCGRISEQKNPDQFNEIAQSLSHLKQIKFIWIGDGEPQKRSLLNASNIEVTGWLNKNEVLTTMKTADIYLSTALWEGLPLAVLEAMSLGKPLVLSNCIGNIDLVKNGFNGYKFEESHEAVNKILELSQDHLKLLAFGKNSRMWCETDFNVVHTYAKYQALYHESLLNKFQVNSN